ncbi:MAG: hypothetical protein HC824_04120 [Synechococcales cyanobacterium RM1_1_8]|nr:hypothetical protein [Synechococcales cyanobacterium RM1_1_8]
MALSDEELLAYASAWGFRCEADALGIMEIYPPRDSEADWKMMQRGDRWVLFAHGEPQLNFYLDDVLKFLKQRRSA